MAIRWIDDLEQDPQATLGKFVLLEQGGEYLFVRSSPRIAEYHAQIVDRYAKRQGLKVNLNADHSDLVNAPTNFLIHGGGYWEQLKDGRIRLFAKSAAFGRFDESLVRGLGFDREVDWIIEGP